MKSDTTEISLNTILVHRPLRHTDKTPSGRIYSRELLEQFINDWMTGGKTMFGTLGQTAYSRQAHVTDLSEVATIVIGMHVDDEGLVIQQQMVDTPSGNILLDLYKKDVTVNVLPRIIGRVDDEGNVYDAKLYGFYFDNGQLPSTDVE